VLDVCPANGYNLFYDAAEPVGGLDKYVKAAGAATAYPVWLRLAKAGGRFSAWYRNKADAAWISIAKDIVPLGAAAPSVIALVSLSHNQAMDGKTVFDDFACLHAGSTSIGRKEYPGGSVFRKSASAAAVRTLDGRRIGKDAKRPSRNFPAASNSATR
jgi:hypothetical protein